MSEKASYFKIGLFVIFAVALLVGGVIVFGSGALDPKPFVVETYFDTSVTGLDVGAKVLFRGVPQGEVREITFVRDAYDLVVGSPAWFKYGSFVAVRIDLYAPQRQGRTAEDLERVLARMVEDGLRVRLATQGLTGIAYLNGDFLDPERYAPFEAQWKPTHFYIPSAPSTFASIGESLDMLTKKLQAVDFDRLFADIDNLAKTILRAVEELDVESLSAKVDAALVGLRQTLDHADAILVDPRFETLLTSASELTSGLNSQVQHGEIRSTFVHLDSTTRDLPKLVGQLARTLRNLDNLVSGESSAVAETLANLRLTSENLRELTSTVKKYPSYVLFGSPPERLTPGMAR